MMAREEDKNMDYLNIIFKPKQNYLYQLAFWEYPVSQE